MLPMTISYRERRGEGVVLRQRGQGTEWSCGIYRHKRSLQGTMLILFVGFFKIKL